mgnify:CR=1 FL=1
MPVNADSYKNGKIYRIWTLLSDEIYIGSTADTLSNRFCKHKSSYKRWLKNKDDNKTYMTSFKLFEKFGVENCKIDLEHNFHCNSKAELHSEEGRVQRIHKAILINNNIAGRTQEEWFSENKEHLAEYNKQYYADNKDAISKQRKQKFVCECGGKYTLSLKSRHTKLAKHQKFIMDNQSLVVAC